MDINLIVKVTSRAWSLSILAHMNKGVAGRQAPLLVATGASRTAFAQSLHHLIELGLLERNPGHGHPLRPEFRITEAGKALAEFAKRLDEIQLGSAPSALLRRAWTVPVLAVCHQPRYFKDIKQNLPAVTDRALSQSLRNLQGESWITREVDEQSGMARPLYKVANQGLEISRAIGFTSM